MDYQLLKFILVATAFVAQQPLAFGSVCVNGKWEEDTCVCNKGYETVSRITTEPSYCSQRSVVVIHIVNTPPFDHRDILDLALPIFCVYILGCCFIGVVYTAWQIGLKFWTLENLRKLKLEKVNFYKSIRKYKHVKMLDADVWELPPMDYLVLNSVKGEHVIQYRRVKVLHDYKAQNVEELNLKKGDIIMDVIELENGWWQGDLNGQIGYFPGDYVQFLDNTKKTGSAMEMNDPEWTQGIQETAITLQYKRMDDQKSKKNDEVVSETSSMYMRDLSKIKKTLNKGSKKWQKKQSDDVTVAASTTKKKTKDVKKEIEEQLLISSDSQSISPENERVQKGRHRGREEKSMKVKDKQKRKQTEESKERLLKDNKLSLTEDDSQLFKGKGNERKEKKGSQGRKHGKQKLTKDDKQSLPESDSQTHIERQDKQKRKENKEKRHREQQKQKDSIEKQDSVSQTSIDKPKIKKENNQYNEKQKSKKRRDVTKMPLISSNSEPTDDIHLKEDKKDKHREHRRKDKRIPEKQSIVETAERAESIERKQRTKKTEKVHPEKQQRKGKQPQMVQSDTSDEKQLKKKSKSSKESKHKQKKIPSDERLSESEQSSNDKKKRTKEKQRKYKRSEQKSSSESTETETFIEPRNKSKGKRTKGKQPKKDVTESSDELSITISDIQFLTESEEEKPKKGFFKRLFKH